MAYFVVTPALLQEVPVSLNGLVLLISELMSFLLEAFDCLKGDFSFDLVQIFIVILDVTPTKFLKIAHAIYVLLYFQRLLRYLILIAFHRIIVFLRNILILNNLFISHIHR